MSHSNALRHSNQVAWLIASEEIRQLASRYAIFYGARDTQNLAALFIPDIKVTRETAGTEALKESFDGQMHALGRVILRLTHPPHQ